MKVNIGSTGYNEQFQFPENNCSQGNNEHLLTLRQAERNSSLETSDLWAIEMVS